MKLARMVQMFKPKLYIVTVILGVLALMSGACAESPSPPMKATPLEIPNGGSPGEYITVRIQLPSEQPCIFVLNKVGKREDYLAPNTASTLAYPDANKIVVWNTQIPVSTPLGNYVLRVIQMGQDEDTLGTEVFRQDFKVK